MGRGQHLIELVRRELFVDLVGRISADKMVNPNANSQQQAKYIKVIFKFADENKALMGFIHENTAQHNKAKLIAML